MAGDGTLFQKQSNSKWYWTVNEGCDPTLKGGKGGYKQRWLDLETTDKNKAIENRKKILAAMVTKGHYEPPIKKTFGEWLDFWLNEIILPKKGPSSTYVFMSA